MEGEEENMCRSQAPRGPTLCHFFHPTTPRTARRRKFETPKRGKLLNLENTEETLFCTPDNLFSPSPMRKPPTLVRKRPRLELSPIREIREEEDEQEVLSQRLKKVRVSAEDSHKDPLPRYFGGSNFSFGEWTETVRNAKATKSEGFYTKVHAKLGRGDFARVYKASEQISESAGCFALKESRNMDDWRKTLFLKEAQALALVEGHPNIVRCQGSWLQVYDQLREERLVILTELCDSDLKGDSRDREVNETRLRKIMKDVASALSYIHALGIVHMDVKPANILVSRCELTGVETFKLADFGMATRVDGKGETTRGAMRYMDTYHLGWGAQVEKGDIFSLAATICDTTSNDPSEEFTQDCVESSWLGSIPDVSEPFKALLQNMLATKREDRPTAQEVVERVQIMDD